MQRNKRIGNPHCCGFTLLELVVVIAVIIVLAGILVATLPDVLNSANRSARLANLVEMDKMIQTYHSLEGGKYPNGWDSLIGSGGGLYYGLPSKAGGDPVGGYLVEKPLADWQVNRLHRAGVDFVYHMKNSAAEARGAANKTYFARDSDAMTPLASGVNLAFLNKSEVYNQTGTDGNGDPIYEDADNDGNPDVVGFKYNLPGCKMSFDSTHDYVVFGVGDECSLIGVGNLVKDNPVVSHPEGCATPKDGYSRVCAIFDLGKSYGGRGRESGVAKFVGCVAVADSYFLFSEEVTNIR